MQNMFPCRGLCGAVGRSCTTITVSFFVRLSAITCSSAVLRPQEEIERLRSKARCATSTVDGKEWSTGLPPNRKTAEAPSSKEVNLLLLEILWFSMAWIIRSCIVTGEWKMEEIRSVLQFAFWLCIVGVIQL
jgi:hypothetical protein